VETPLQHIQIGVFEMRKIIPSLDQFLAFLVGWVVLVVLGATVNTQFALGSLTDLGVQIPFSARIDTTFKDIGNMLPLFGSIFGLGFLIAMTVGNVIFSIVKILPYMVFALAGFASVGVTLLALKAAFQVTAIGAARNWDGFLMLCLAGALAGYVFSLVAMRRRTSPPQPAAPVGS
jgi:hypothetical protein